MIKKTVRTVSLILLAVVLFTRLDLFAFSASKPQRIKLSKTSIELKVKESFHIRSKGKAKVKVRFAPQNVAGGILVEPEDKTLVKVKKINDQDYKLTALKKGKTSVQIRSFVNKKLSKKLHLNITEESKPIIDIDSANFKKEVLTYEGKAVLYFGADWCYFCKLLKPLYKEAGKKLPEYKFCMVDADKEWKLADEHGITGIPRMFVYENGTIIKAGGYQRDMTAEDLVSWIVD